MECFHKNIPSLMFDWALNTPLFTTSFSYRKRSEQKINNLRTFYSKELKNFQTAKSGAPLDNTYESNGSISLKLTWLVCFKLMWSCKHHIWCYNVWFWRCAKSIWPCISNFRHNSVCYSKVLKIQKGCHHSQISIYLINIS